MAERERCRRCHAVLASDNTSVVCGPCSSKATLDDAAPVPPAQLWERAEIRSAIADRHVGRLLRAYRKAHTPAISQQRLAEWLQLTQGHLSILERRRRPETDLERLERWCDAIHLPVRLRWFRGPDAPGIVDRAVEPSGALVARVRTNLRPARSGVGVWSVSHLLADDARDATRFARQISETGLTRSALEQLAGEVDGFAANYVSRPLAELFADIRELRRHVFGLVEHNRFPDQMSELYLQASRLGGLQSHICLDLGHYDAAHTHARTAFLCAELAGHNRMRGWARGLQSLIAYWDGSLSAAIDFAGDGVRYAGSGSIAARLPSLEARACAAHGDRRGEQARDRVGDGDGEAGVFTFPAAKQSAYAGTTLLALGDPDVVARAVRESSAALASYEAAPPADRSSGDVLAARLDLGRAHLMQADLDGLAEQLQIVLAVPQGRRTASIVKRAASIADSLSAARYADSSRSVQIRADIATFCAARPALPPAQPPREGE